MRRIHLIAAVVMHLLIAWQASAQTVRKTMDRLPDTGQLTGFTTIDGEDADVVIDPPGYIEEGAVVFDTVTKLMWQATDGGEMTWEEARSYVDTLGLAGFVDWRLPNAHELFSINDFGRRNPAMHPVFTYTGAEYWWSTDTLLGDGTKVWCTNAGGGIGAHPRTETISAGGTKKFHVRAVRDRSTPAVVASHFVDQEDGTVDDMLTGRHWQQFCLEGTYTWEEALRAADTLVAYGASDWRLPNIRELQSLNVEHRRTPSVELLYFPCVTPKVPLWSSTTMLSATNSQAWILQPDQGIVTYREKQLTAAVLCVRGGDQQTTSVDASQENEGAILWPNPTIGTISLREDVLRYGIYDLTGRTVLVGSSQSVDIADRPSGVYVISLRLHDGTRLDVPLVKMP